MELRVNLTYERSRYRVDLPSYKIVPGTFLPLNGEVIRADGISNLASPEEVMLLGPSVVVIVPDDECTDFGLCPIKMRYKYRGQLAIDNPGLKDRLRKVVNQNGVDKL